jgi:hypothetical protein
MLDYAQWRIKKGKSCDMCVGAYLCKCILHIEDRLDLADSASEISTKPGGQ